MVQCQVVYAIGYEPSSFYFLRIHISQESGSLPQGLQTLFDEDLRMGPAIRTRMASDRSFAAAWNAVSKSFELDLSMVKLYCK